MKAKELIEQLLKVDPELDVMAAELDNSSRVWSISSVKSVVAEDGEYPEDYDMPEGFAFVRLD